MLHLLPLSCNTQFSSVQVQELHFLLSPIHAHTWISLNVAVGRVEWNPPVTCFFGLGVEFGSVGAVLQDTPGAVDALRLCLNMVVAEAALADVYRVPALGSILHAQKHPMNWDLAH